MATITYDSIHGINKYKTNFLGGWLDDETATIDMGDNYPLTEIGTIIQSAVNTNSDEFQWSGFSAGNYLTYPYDAAFDLTGAVGHTVMAWVNVGAITDIETIMDRQDVGGTGARWSLSINADGTVRSTVYDGTDVLNTDTTTVITDNGWVFIAASWNDVDTQTIYINGAVDVIDAGGALVGSLVNGTAIFRIGLSATGTDPCAQGLSVCRIFDGELTSGAIQEMFEAEKGLFKTNSTYVIYDTSLDLIFPAMQLDRSAQADRSVAMSIGGVQQVIFNREDVFWDVTSSEVTTSTVLSFQYLLSAVLRGATLQFDPYDTGDAIDCVFTSNGYSAVRIGTSEYFTFTFRLKEL